MFGNLDEYQLMKNQLDAAGIKFNRFVTYCLNLVWNQMLEEYKRQQLNAEEDAVLAAEVLKEMQDEAAGDELEGDTESVSESESLDSEEPVHG